jgi:hypothetical protein
MPRIKALRSLTRDEIDGIVWSIARELDPLRPEINKREIESRIRERIDLLQPSLNHMKAIPTFAATRATADRISKRLDALIEEITRLPKGTAFEFWKIAGLFGFSRRASARAAHRLRAALTVLRSREGLSDHVDRENLVCAAAAHEMIKEFSKRVPSGSDGGPLRTIAALLFEAVTGRRATDRQFKRACDNLLRICRR